jgi:hypothetical protein
VRDLAALLIRACIPPRVRSSTCDDADRRRPSSHSPRPPARGSANGRIDTSGGRMLARLTSAAHGSVWIRYAMTCRALAAKHMRIPAIRDSSRLSSRDRRRPTTERRLTRPARFSLSCRFPHNWGVLELCAPGHHHRTGAGPACLHQSGEARLAWAPPGVQVVMAACPRRMSCEQWRPCELTSQRALRLRSRPGRRCRSRRRGASLSAQLL